MFNFFALLPNFHFWNGDLAVGWVYTTLNFLCLRWILRFWNFTDISLFPKFLSPKWFGNLWCSSYIQHLVIKISLHSTCQNENYSKTWKSIRYSVRDFMSTVFSLDQTLFDYETAGNKNSYFFIWECDIKAWFYWKVKAS